MKNVKNSGLLAALLMAGVLTGCGLSPQQLQPEPRLSGQLEQVANGQTVVVSIEDQRESNVLGYRGGMYAETNALTLEGATVFPRLQAEMEVGLRMRGFNIATPEQARNDLRLIISEAEYSVAEDRTFASKVELRLVMTVEVKNGTQIFRGRYTETLSKPFAKAPSDKGNNQLVSEVMSTALERIFADDDLLAFLQK